MLAARHLTSCSSVYSTRLVTLLQHHRSVAMSAAAVAASYAPVQRISAPKVAVGQMTAVGDQVTNFETCSKLAKVRKSASVTLQIKQFCTCSVFILCCTRCTSTALQLQGISSATTAVQNAHHPCHSQPLSNWCDCRAAHSPGSTGGRSMYAVPT